MKPIRQKPEGRDRPQRIHGALSRGRGRPTKRGPDTAITLLQGLAEGLPRCRAAARAGITARTLNRWLLTDKWLLQKVRKTEHQARDKRAMFIWRHHPFRGRRPPRPPHLRHLPYPKPLPERR